VRVSIKSANLWSVPFVNLDFRRTVTSTFAQPVLVLAVQQTSFVGKTKGNLNRCASGYRHFRRVTHHLSNFGFIMAYNFWHEVKIFVIPDQRMVQHIS